LRKGLKYAYLTAGMVCFGYYFLLGYSSRFGLSMSWIWILGGIALCAAGFVCGSGGIPRWLRIAWRALLCGGLALVMALECLVISGMNSAPPQGLDYLIVLGARVEGNGPSLSQLDKEARENEEPLTEKENDEKNNGAQGTVDNAEPFYSGTELDRLSARIEEAEYIPFRIFLTDGKVTRIMEMDSLYR